jgi:hypothetical protein
MMFEEDRSQVPRAYTALPDRSGSGDLQESLGKAISWCTEQADGGISRIGIQIGRKADLEDLPLLAALARRGASIHVDVRGKIGSLPSGPVLLYMPVPSHLWQLEERRGPSAVAAVGITGPSLRTSILGTSYVGAQPWVSAYRPKHLAGPAIEAKTPIIPDASVWAALKTFTNLINSSTGLAHHSDRSAVIEGLTKLRSAGHAFDPNDLLAGALALNWRGSAAVELCEIAKEINDGRHKRFSPVLRDDIIERWEAEGRESGTAEPVSLAVLAGPTLAI